MLARRKLRRRIDDALATASPLALAEAMDANICSRAPEDVRALVERSIARMDAGDRAQLELYLNLDQPDDLMAHRLSAFLRQNPRAIAALDPDAVNAILRELGEIPAVPHPVRRLSSSALALVALVLAVALLPLAAQYAHQRGLLQGLSDPFVAPVVVPFVERIVQHHASAAVRKPRPKPVAHRVVRHPVARAAAPAPVHHAVAVRHHRPRLVRSVAWKFDPRNNPYMNPQRWHHPYKSDASLFGARARLSVQSYLHALVAGNLQAALVHLGMPPTGDTNALAELPIITRSSMVAILGSNVQPDGKEKVQANIMTGKREYFAVFWVERDGPATRIVDHYYIPVNRSAQIASRAESQ